MSGPKCDYFELSYEEEQRIAREEQKRLEEEARRRREQKLKEERRRREKERRRQEEEKQRRIEQQLREEQEFDDGVDQILMEMERQEFLECVSLYEAAADHANVEPIPYEFDEANWEAQREEIKSQIENLKNIYHEIQCRERVNEIIVETMEDMGYEIMAERPIDQGVSMAKLYQYGDDAAISMLAHDGKFTFEVVATDNRDRMVSREEAVELEEKMNRFCDDYAGVMEKLDLDERLNRQEVFHKPADKKYARVINTAVYNSLKPKEYKKKYGEDYNSETSATGRRNNGKGII